MKLTGPACIDAMSEAEEARGRERAKGNAGEVRVEREVRPIGLLIHVVDCCEEQFATDFFKNEPNWIISNIAPSLVMNFAIPFLRMKDRFGEALFGRTWEYGFVLFREGFS